MTREQARDRLLDYAYGELSPAEAAEFEAVLRDDPDLQADLDAVSMVQEAASGLPRPDLPPAVRGRILMAARSEAHKRAMARRWASIQDLFLSPIFLGATAIIAAVGVGVHLILTQGTEDPWSRIDREQRVAVLSSAEPAPAAMEPGTPPAAEPAAEPAGGKADPMAGEKAVAHAAAPAERSGARNEVGAGVLGLATEETRQGAEGAERRGGTGGLGRIAARPRAQARAAEQAFGSASGAGIVTGGAGTGGGGAVGSASPAQGRARVDGEADALAYRAMPSDEAAPASGKGKASAGPARTWATAPVRAGATTSTADKDREAAEERQVAEDREVYKEEAKVLAGDDRGRFASPPPASAPVPPAPETVAAPAAMSAPEAETRDTATPSAKAQAPAVAKPAPAKAARVAPEDPADWLAEARDLRAAGYLADALDAYRRALTAGPTGSLLADVLAEAAEVAKALGRTSEADGYLARLERLPDGPARAAKIRAK